MQALKCLCIRILNVNTTFNSNQSKLSTLIDILITVQAVK